MSDERGAGHVPKRIGRVFSRRNCLRRFEDGRLGDGASLGDIKRVAGFAELCAIAVREAEPGQNSIGVVDTGFVSGQRNGGCGAAGAGGEARNLQGSLNVADQSVVVRSEIRYGGSTGVVENVACSSAFVGRIQNECFRIPETAHNFVNEELRCDSERDIGVVVFVCRGDADGMIPHFVAVKQNQTNGLSPCFRQGIPCGCTGSTAAAGKRDIPVDRVAGCACGVVFVRLNTVQRIVCIGNVIVPGEMPAQIFDICRFRGTGSVGLISNRELTVQHSRVVAMVGIVKQQDACRCAGCCRNPVFIVGLEIRCACRAVSCFFRRI